MSQKMNTLLAIVEHGTSRFNRMIADYGTFFKKNQGGMLLLMLRMIVERKESSMMGKLF